jgi:hypothetical protein
MTGEMMGVKTTSWTTRAGETNLISTRMKNTNQSTNGTSFHGSTFTATVQDLRKILGEPDSETNDGDDKVNFEWEMETDDGEVFTVYDWKEYRRLEEDELIEWHIGGHSPSATAQAENEIAERLNSL